MALYSELSAQDQAVVQNTVNLIRAGAGEIAKVFNHLNAIAADTNATALVTSVDAGETIPLTSGLGGADSMTRAELVAMYNILIAMRDVYDTPTNRAAWSKAAGINALLG